MRQTSTLLVLATLTLLAFPSTLSAQAPDAFLGTWRINYEKSKFAGPPRTLTMERAEEGIHIVLDNFNAEGQPNHTELIAKFDGSEAVRTSGGNPDNPQPVYTRINSHAYEVDWPSGAKSRTFISPDGNTRVEVGMLTDAEGGTRVQLLVYDKQ